ncbi:hypothetical protein F4809DRAFT_11545 [Biscogniauxia mediterranea]|nr:hypothetical protein F4809DRAFT_11545 [Biscogniauxia mediterranea]
MYVCVYMLALIFSLGYYTRLSLSLPHVVIHHPPGLFLPLPLCWCYACHVIQTWSSSCFADFSSPSARLIDCLLAGRATTTLSQHASLIGLNRRRSCCFLYTVYTILPSPNRKHSWSAIYTLLPSYTILFHTTTYIFVQVESCLQRKKKSSRYS